MYMYFIVVSNLSWPLNQLLDKLSNHRIEEFMSKMIRMQTVRAITCVALEHGIIERAVPRAKSRSMEQIKIWYASVLASYFALFDKHRQHGRIVIRLKVILGTALRSPAR